METRLPAVAVAARSGAAHNVGSRSVVNRLRRRRRPTPPPPPLEPGQILTCGLRHRHVWPFHNPPEVASDLVVSLTTLPQRSETLPLMLRSLAAGWTVPRAIYVVDGGDHARPNACPSYLSRHRGRHTVDVHFVRAASDRGPIEKYIGAEAAIPRRGRARPPPTFLLVLDDDHVYKRWDGRALRRSFTSGAGHGVYRAVAAVAVFRVAAAY